MILTAVTKVYIIRKTILSAFHYFLFHKNIPNTFEVIALLLKTNIIFGNFLVNFCLICPDIQPNVTFLTEITATGFNSLKKPFNIPVYPYFGKKKMLETPKNDKILRKFGISRQISAN